MRYQQYQYKNNNADRSNERVNGQDHPQRCSDSFAALKSHKNGVEMPQNAAKPNINLKVGTWLGWITSRKTEYWPAWWPSNLSIHLSTVQLYPHVCPIPESIRCPRISAPKFPNINPKIRFTVPNGRRDRPQQVSSNNGRTNVPNIH